MACGKMTEQVIPTRWDYKTSQIRCGGTGYYGYQIICPDCQAKGVEPKEHDYYDIGEHFSEEDY